MPDVVEASSLWTGARAVNLQGRAAKALVMHQDPVAVYPHSLFDRWLKPDTISTASAIPSGAICTVCRRPSMPS